MVQIEKFNIEEKNSLHFLLSGGIVKKECINYERNKEKELLSWSSVIANICGSYAEKIHLFAFSKM